mmetsp:Transcript_16216/g.34241  ORF Transcript_16216/g.34241 Transcript_16216/m.34241 type:complete len:88 (-) Transcript_16216:398-661(-)
MMQAIMFNVPRLRLHPIQPIDTSIDQSESKSPAVEPPGIDAVVSAVTGVMRDHRPGGVRPRAQRGDGDGIGRGPDGGQSDEGGDVSP